MRITEALKILHSAENTSSPFPVALACGFTPLHLSTFLAAHLQQRLPNRKIEISVGLYGDLAGTLESLEQTSAHAIAVALEWSDLDPRLGFRSAGRWGAAAIADILSEMPRLLRRLTAALARIPAHIPVAVSAPTLPLPPLFHTTGWQAGEPELALESIIAESSLRFQDRPNTRVINTRRLADDSPSSERFDLKSELVIGFPYTTQHADVLSSALVELLAPVTPKKGLITDLDDTLWSGLVGEVGPEGVTWDLASHKALHGVYQKLLAALAEEGVLIAVASKNDPEVVARAFQREDILIPPASIFPMEVHWHAKSGSVARILKRWNILADSVVFVDDNPMELAEVAAAHPGIECIQFPAKDYSKAGLWMLRRLRDLFGKDRLTQEDALRLNSIRSGADFEDAAKGENASEDFLRNLGSVVHFDFPDESPDPRLLELVNKTNQFNLNGTRFTETEWVNKRFTTDCFLAAVSYEDKFGPLGKIAVMQGCVKHRSLRLNVWVLSCRAFARRIEHQCLQMLFDRYGLDLIEFAFARTEKNGPLFEFLRSVTGTAPGSNCVLTRSQFEQFCPPLYHTVKETRRVEVNG